MLKRPMSAAAIAALMMLSTPAQSAQSDSMTKLRFAQKTKNTPSSVKDVNRNVKLTDAASINEDLIGLALDGKTDKVAEKVAAMRGALTTLRPLLNDNIFEILGRQVTEMEQASFKNGVLGTALVAVEVYRTIENAMDGASRPSPIEVAMMDYSGFKLSILTAAQAADWATIAETAKGSDGYWSTLAKKIPDTSIRNLVGAIQDGLGAAVERKDVYGVRFAAKMQLEVVDVLEQYFKGTYKTRSEIAR